MANEQSWPLNDIAMEIRRNARVLGSWPKPSCGRPRLVLQHSSYSLARSAVDIALQPCARRPPFTYRAMQLLGSGFEEYRRHYR